MSALASNFTLQDILGMTLAFLLFPLVIVFPGYVCGWALNLLDFRRRRPIVRLGMGLVLSCAISPVLFDLTSSLVSPKLSLLVVGAFALAFVMILIREKPVFSSGLDPQIKTLLGMGAVWVIFVMLYLIHIQWKDQLYISEVTDQSTRAFVIDAMTRTGVPPANPGYFPRQPIPLTVLYYFWYVLCSLIDVIGGRLVDARATLNASSAWSGLSLMAIVALYFRLRNKDQGETSWRSAKIGIGLLAVGGLDSLPLSLLLAKVWNIPGIAAGSNSLQFAISSWYKLETTVLTLLGAWIDSNLWIPHHIAAVVACFVGFLLAQSARGETPSRQFALLSIAGAGFASAFGLSFWVPFVFAIFWTLWILALLLQKTQRSLLLAMVFAGVLGVLLIIPFLAGIFKGGGSGSGQLPLMFEIRPVAYVEPFVKDWSPLARSLIRLIATPLDLLAELGFFFLAGICWFRLKDKGTERARLYYLPEIILITITILTTSFFRSTIGNNDLGWRGWLPGQFVLLLWGVDVIEAVFFRKENTTPSIPPRNLALLRNSLLAAILFGIMTTAVNATFTRIFYPALNGSEIGKQTYSARLAYDYLRNRVPSNIIVQNNPAYLYDGTSGLYGTHQMVAYFLIPYGVSLEDFNKLANQVGVLFSDANVTNWRRLDRTCQRYSIGVLIVKDTDPVWSALPTLEAQRPALYKNTRYALYACGEYATSAP